MADAGSHARLEARLEELEELLAHAKTVPLSSSIMLHRAEVDTLVGDIRAAVPEEVKQARWIIKERDDVLAQARAEAGAIVAAAHQERAQLVSQTEIKRTAEAEIERLLTEAREESRVVRLEADDYVDAQLAKFEVLLHKTLQTVERGRENLHGRLGSDALAEVDDDEDGRAR